MASSALKIFKNRNDQTSIRCEHNVVYLTSSQNARSENLIYMI